MRGFARETDGTITAELSSDETMLLRTLVTQLMDVVGSADRTDPAVLRLLPDAYPDDPESSAEFRRYTTPGLIDRKLAHASRILDTLDRIEDERVSLDTDAVQSWLRGLTDLRLTLAERIGVSDDQWRPDRDDPTHALYDWLGFVQMSLVAALELPVGVAEEGHG